MSPYPTWCSAVPPTLSFIVNQRGNPSPHIGRLPMFTIPICVINPWLCPFLIPITVVTGGML